MQNRGALSASGIRPGMGFGVSLIGMEIRNRARGESWPLAALDYTRSRATRRCTRMTASVLVAEDDICIRHQNMIVLEKAGYGVTGVDNGLSAWEALQRGSFDLLITDNDMPSLTGLELVAKLRLGYHKLPIILASGSADFFRADEYRWLAISAFLQKPYRPTELVQSVQQILQSKLS